MADLADEIDDYQEEEEPLFADDLEDFPEDEPPPLPPPLDFSGPSPTTDGLRVGLGPTSGSPEQAQRTRHSIRGDGGDTGEKEVVQRKRKPILTLTVDRLFSEKGIPHIVEEFPKLKFRGRGHEAADLKRLLKEYERWANNLYPAFTFRDFINRVEAIGSNNKGFKSKFRVMRQGASHGHDPTEDNELGNNDQSRDDLATDDPPIDNAVASDQPMNSSVVSDPQGDNSDISINHNSEESQALNIAAADDDDDGNGHCEAEGGRTELEMEITNWDNMSPEGSTEPEMVMADLTDENTEPSLDNSSLCDEL